MEQIVSELFVSHVWDSTKDHYTSLSDVTLPNNSRKIGNFVKILQLNVGTKVILTTNLNVIDGLTNGGHCDTCSMVVSAFNGCSSVRFCSDSIGLTPKSSSPYKHISPDAVPIKRAQTAFWIYGAERFQTTRLSFLSF